MKTIELTLEGIKCMGCVNRIKNVLEPIKGIKIVDISLEDKKLILTYKKEESLEKAIDAIENLGFKVLQRKRVNKKE